MKKILIIIILILGITLGIIKADTLLSDTIFGVQDPNLKLCIINATNNYVYADATFSLDIDITKKI